LFLLNDDLLDDVSVGLAKPVESDFESGDVDQRIVFLYDITFPHNPSSGGIGAGNEGVSISAEEDFWRRYSRPLPRTSELIDVDGPVVVRTVEWLTERQTILAGTPWGVRFALMISTPRSCISGDLTTNV